MTTTALAQRATPEQITAEWDARVRAYLDTLSVDRLASLRDETLADRDDPGAAPEIDRLVAAVGWIR
jgi:hypothetical protein